MIQCVDPVVPISRVITRLEAHQNILRNELVGTHWWQYRKRWAIAGGIATYELEIEALLALAASCQPIIGSYSVKN